MNQEDRAVEMFQQNKTYKEIGSELGISRLKTGLLIADLRKAGRIGYRDAAKSRRPPVTAEIITLQPGDLKSQLSAFMRSNAIGPMSVAKLLGVSHVSVHNWMDGKGPSRKNRERIQSLISGGTRVLEKPKSAKKARGPDKSEGHRDIPYWDTPYWHLDREIMSRDPSKIRHILRALWRLLSPR